jgi:hypothetical protein
MMSLHATTASRSPMLSFTLNPGTAHAFTEAGGGSLMIQIDSRRALPNLHGLSSEYEVLVPLIVFPDEIVHLERSKLPAPPDTRNDPNAINTMSIDSRNTEPLTQMTLEFANKKLNLNLTMEKTLSSWPEALNNTRKNFYQIQQLLIGFRCEKIFAN